MSATARAHKLSITEPLPAKLRFLLETIGPRITAAALGLSDARMLTKWAGGYPPRRTDIEHRVEILYEVAAAVTAAYSGPVAASFLRSASPTLDDCSPLMVLREADPHALTEVQARLRAATRTYLEVAS